MHLLVAHFGDARQLMNGDDLLRIAIVVDQAARGELDAFHPFEIVHRPVYPARSRHRIDRIDVHRRWKWHFVFLLELLHDLVHLGKRENEEKRYS